MKKVEEIFELLDGIIPTNADKTVFYCEVEKTAYEIFFNSYFEDGVCKHSSELVDSGEMDNSVIESGFEKIANFIRNSDQFNEGMRNVVTICIEGTTEKVELKQFEKTVGLYKIKKEWKEAHNI